MAWAELLPSWLIAIQRGAFRDRILLEEKGESVMNERKEAERDFRGMEATVDSLLRRVGGDDYVCTLAKSVTHLCFRNGPVENMHAAGKLDEADMMVLNKYMVDQLGLFFLLLGLADADSLMRVLRFHDQCGLDWDDPDIGTSLSRYCISHERINALIRSRLKITTRNDDAGISSLLNATTIDHDLDEDLAACPMCGSRVLIRDPRTNLSFVLSHNRRVCTNKALAKEAQVPLQLVTDMQFVERTTNPSAKQLERMKAVAEVLDASMDYIIAFNPFASTVRCDDCKTSAPWAVWNVRRRGSC